MKNIYRRIIQVCIETDEQELLAGIPSHRLSKKLDRLIQQFKKPNYMMP
jgi:hypothetical protein